MLILVTILVYFALLLGLSRLTARRSDNDTFFRGNRRSPWYMVAFGMVGASISGITFVSVPGMVLKSDMTYLQMCLGFIPGYFAVAFILLPVYYRLRLTTIYTYLQGRLGRRSYKTGASFFLLSKMTGAAVRFYVVCIILQRFVLDAVGVPFPVTVVVMVALIWLYTRRGGIKTLVWTDTFQTFCMFAALVLIIVNVIAALNMSVGEAVSAIAHDAQSRIFVFDDWVSRQNFWKQFLSGIFVVVVMTGLDQDMMQKNLTCKTLRDAQKDMCSYGFAFLPANLLFLALGILLTILAAKTGTPIPQQGDELLPMFAATGMLGSTVTVLFTIGVVAAAFSSADSALTALTTSFCVDIAGREGDEGFRHKAHIGIAVVFAMFILAFKAANSTSVIDAIYILCSYTYGPLLGLFAYGLFTKQPTDDRLVPYVCIASPLVCLAIDYGVRAATGYVFGYELLMLNGALTFVGLAVAPKFCKRKKYISKTLALSACLLLPFAAQAQDVESNYVSEQTMLDRSGMASVATVRYYDGLGWPSLTATTALGTSGNAAYSLTEYGYHGMPSKEWLPAVGDGQPVWTSEAEVRQMSVRSNGDAHPYSYTAYDLNGNIVSLWRKGMDNTGRFSTIDSLTISYDGNRIESASDPKGRLVYDYAFDFKPGGGGTYAYDANGAMTYDPDKDASISYSDWGTPSKIYVNNGCYTEYTYVSNGEKLKVVWGFEAISKPWKPTYGEDWDVMTAAYTPEEDVTAVAEMCGPFTVVDGVLDKFYFDGGFCTFDGDTATFYYYIKDHNGSNLMVVAEDGTLEQVSYYYPFGGEFAERNHHPELQPYRYAGKEYDHMHGLDLYDFGARMYDPAVARWTTMDPLCEQYYGISPYAYCTNDPVNNADPDGRKVIIKGNRD